MRNDTENEVNKQAAIHDRLLGHAKRGSAGLAVRSSDVQPVHSRLVSAKFDASRSHRLVANGTGSQESAAPT